MIKSGYTAEDLARMGPDELTRKRQLANALLSEAMGQRRIEHPLQGLAQMSQALIGGLQARKVDKAEGIRAGKNAELSKMLLGGLMGGSSGYPSAPAPASGGMAAPTAARPTMGDVASNRVAQAHDGDRAAYIRSGLVSRGLPEHIAQGFVMNMQDESNLNPGINEANPIVPGSRGGFGLNQWTGPRRRAYEAFAAERGTPLDDIDTQLDFTMMELQGPESRAAQSILAAEDAGSAAAAIVNNFLRPAEQHRASREKRYLSSAGATPTALAPISVSGGQNDPQALAAALGAPAPQLASPQTIQDRPVQTAQANGGFPMQEMAGRNPQALPGINPALIEALSSPYADDNTKRLGQALLGQQMGQQEAAQERMRAEQEARLQMQQRMQAAEAAGVDPRFIGDDEIWKAGVGQQFREDPTSVQEYEYYAQQARAAGQEPVPYSQFQVDQKRAGATTIDTGTIPQGYQAVRDEAGRVVRYEPIPGGPADTSATDAAALEGREVSTGIITNAAARAREALRAPGLPSTGTVGSVLAGLPETNAAELRRQVEVLQANAKIENLQAMRAASPTGGALGAVSDKENAMLSAKSGALDPNSPTFERDLDDYERTLLRIVHGPKVGDAIFEQSRPDNQSKPFTDMTDEELEAIIYGD